MWDLTRFKKKKNFNPKKKIEPRIKFLIFVFVIFGLLIIGRLFNFQVLKYGYYSALASDQHEIYRKLFAERGTIYMIDKMGSKLNKHEVLYSVAINKDFNLVYAQPKYIEKSAQEIAEALTPILEPDPEKQEGFKKIILEKLNKTDDPYEELKDRVEDSQVEMIEQLQFAGIKSIKKSSRYYPENNLAAQVLGFVSRDERTGKYGIEGYFNQELSGKQGEIISENDIAGRIISVGTMNMTKAEDGADIILTIDRNMQYQVCKQVSEHAKVLEAKSAAAVVMDPQTGEIIAMCSYPDFNPNEYNLIENNDLSVYNNRTIYEPYEPGSIFKPITMAAGLDLGLITPETSYIDVGQLEIDEEKINNADKQAHGLRTMTEVLEMSLNTGTVFVSEKLGQRNLRHYLEKFGFGKKTGIQLETELEGNISSLDKKAEIYTATASFGQGITVTPLQMVQAFSAIANGGKLVRPYLVEEIRYPDGRVVKTQHPQPQQVISSKTATLLSGMLVSVIENGQGNQAKIPGYYAAGKTGTAQIPVPGGYSQTETNHSFIGFAPLKDPAFVLIIKFEAPKHGSYSSVTTAPLFSRIAKTILDYYHVMPDAL